MMTQTQSFGVALVIIVLSITLLAPRIARPSEHTFLLNESVRLTDAEYEWQYSLTFNKGVHLDVRVTTKNQLVNFKITQVGSRPVVLYDEAGQTFYDFGWTVSEYGPYAFSLVADTGNVDATVTITKA